MDVELLFLIIDQCLCHQFTLVFNIFYREVQHMITY